MLALEDLHGERGTTSDLTTVYLPATLITFGRDPRSGLSPFIGPAERGPAAVGSQNGETNTGDGG